MSGLAWPFHIPHSATMVKSHSLGGKSEPKVHWTPCHQLSNAGKVALVLNKKGREVVTNISPYTELEPKFASPCTLNSSFFVFCLYQATEKWESICLSKKMDEGTKLKWLMKEIYSIFRTKHNLNQNHVILIQVQYFFFLKKKSEWKTSDFLAWHFKNF